MMRRVGPPPFWPRSAPLLLLMPLAACSFSFSAGGPDYGKLEAEIHDELTSQYADIGHEPSAVECPHPKPPPKAGDTFVCTATVDDDEDQTIRIEATVGDDHDVKYRTLDTLYDLPTAGQKLGPELSQNQGFPITVDCGEGVKVVADGDSFDCTAADPRGHTRTVKVTAGGTEGNDRWELLP